MKDLPDHLKTARNTQQRRVSRERIEQKRQEEQLKYQLKLAKKRVKYANENNKPPRPEDLQLIQEAMDNTNNNVNNTNNNNGAPSAHGGGATVGTASASANATSSANATVTPGTNGAVTTPGTPGTILTTPGTPGTPATILAPRRPSSSSRRGVARLTRSEMMALTPRQRRTLQESLLRTSAEASGGIQEHDRIEESLINNQNQRTVLRDNIREDEALFQELVINQPVEETADAQRTLFGTPRSHSHEIGGRNNNGGQAPWNSPTVNASSNVGQGATTNVVSTNNVASASTNNNNVASTFNNATDGSSSNLGGQGASFGQGLTPLFGSSSVVGQGFASTPLFGSPSLSTPLFGSASSSTPLFGSSSNVGQGAVLNNGGHTNNGHTNNVASTANSTSNSNSNVAAETDTAMTDMTNAGGAAAAAAAPSPFVATGLGPLEFSIGSGSKTKAKGPRAKALMSPEERQKSRMAALYKSNPHDKKEDKGTPGSVKRAALQNRHRDIPSRNP